ncbi:MAG: NUDIX domain-containing protein [Myxococcota bacterium]
MSATPQPAATVILVRDAGSGPEVLLIERHPRSDFLPDFYVFPGGRVEEGDAALTERVHGVSREQAAARIPSVAPEAALSFFVAAIRETFEEAGILLARRRGANDLIDAEATRDLARHRLALQAGDLDFGRFVEAEDLELAADALSVHAHWITPEAVPRRFDTLFFCAVAPPGQLAVHDGVETTSHVWIRPQEALEQAEKGERQIIFPTASNLRTLCGWTRAREAMAASRRRPVVAVLPSVETREGRRMLVIRPDAGYEITCEALPESGA